MSDEALYALVDNADPVIQDRTIIQALYDYRCVRCAGHGLTVHELVPRSIARLWGLPAFKLRNRVPLCPPCHEWAQAKAMERALWLRESADVMLVHRHKVDEYKALGFTGKLLAGPVE